MMVGCCASTSTASSSNAAFLRTHHPDSFHFSETAVDMKRRQHQNNGNVASMAGGADSSSARKKRMPFALFGEYMSEKKRKLSLQFQEEASNDGMSGISAFPIADLDSSSENLKITSTINSKNLSKLFNGISIFVDGFTVPSHQKLRALMIKHGGNFENYFSRELVTHIVCSTLPDSKIRNQRSFSRGLPIVKPSWIVDSINCGKVLPVISYSLERIMWECPNQRTISDILNSGRNNSNEILNQVESQPLKESTKALQLDQPINIPQIKDNNDEHKASLKVDDIHNNRNFDRFPESSTMQSSFSKQKSDLKPIHSSDQEPTFPNDGSFSDTVWKHCTRSDSNFVQNYFKNSRLHFIGTWRNRYQNRFKSKSAESQKEKNLHDYSIDSSERIIMHIDMDCFFVSVVVRNQPLLAGKPVAVCHSEKANGTAEISSSNYAARKFGIKSGMFIRDAKSLCPELEIVHYDFEGYEQVADQFYEILHKYCKRIQAVSCDEAYLDVTGIENPETLASTIRREIFHATQCTASVGIAENLLLARLATRKAKPDGQYKIASGKAKEFLSDLPIEDLPGVGWSLQEKLHYRGIYNCSHLQAVSKECLQDDFGSKTGEMLWCYARGIDHREVQDNQERKSIGAEVNWGVRFDTAHDAEHFLSTLCNEVCTRLQSSMHCGRTFTLKIKKKKAGAGEPLKFMGCGSCDNLSKSVTLASATDNIDILLRITKQMFTSFHLDVREIRGMGLQASRLESSLGHANDQVPLQQKLLKSCFKIGPKDVDIEPERSDISSGSASETHKLNDGIINKRKIEKKMDLQGWGKIVKGPFSAHDKIFLQKNNENDKTSAIHNLPDASKLDLSVLAALPEDIVAEIKDAYNGAIPNFLTLSKNYTDNKTSCLKLRSESQTEETIKSTSDQTCALSNKKSLGDAPSTPKAKFNISEFCQQRKAECLGNASKFELHERQAVPSSLSQIDMATLKELPTQIQDDILNGFTGCLSHRNIKHENSDAIMDSGCLDGPNQLADLWCGSPPKWVSLFHGLNGAGAEVLQHLSKSFVSCSQKFSSAFRHMVSCYKVCNKEEFDSVLFPCCFELLKQYLMLKISSDLEEIFVIARFLKRLADQAQCWGRLWKELAPLFQATTGERYGGTLYISE